MLEEQDFKKLGEVIKENTEVNNKKLREEVIVAIEVNNKKLREEVIVAIEANNIKIAEEFGKVIEQNIAPVLDSLDKRLIKIETKVDNLETKVDKLEGDVAKLPDKHYLEDRLGNLAEEIWKRLDRRLEKEQSFKEKITEIVKRNKLATSEEVAYLEGLLCK